MRSLAQLFDLTGRVAIVTGGSRGLGQEMAEGLAEAGAALMLCARRESWLDPAVHALRAQGASVEGMVCDVSRAADVEAVVEATIQRLGKVDILVNNAGISWGAEPEAMPLDKWQKVLDVNLTGAFLFAQTCAHNMLARGNGCIINVSSIAGLQAAVHGPHYAAYAASKAGLLGLTRELAATWGPKGIRVNAIAPGFFPSRLSEPVLPVAEAAVKARNPLPRVGQTGELKGVVVFLAADASSYVTGQVLVVDGGGTIA